MNPDTLDSAAAWRVLERSETLVTPAEVDLALDRLAGEITAAYGGADPILLCVLNGGIVPMGRLLPRLNFPLRIDYVHATRYRSGTRGGEIHWRRPPPASVRDRQVLLVDDIFDEGFTLEAIAGACVQAGAAAVASVVLVEKRRPRACGYRPDFVGLEIPDRYVFGEGMDYHEYLRNLPGIHAVAPEDL